MDKANYAVISILVSAMGLFLGGLILGLKTYWARRSKIESEEISEESNEMLEKK